MGICFSTEVTAMTICPMGKYNHLHMPFHFCYSTFLLCAFSSVFKRYVDSSWQLWNRSLISALLSSAQTADVLAMNNAKDSKTSCIVCINSVGSKLHSFMSNLLRLRWHQMWWTLQPHLIGQFTYKWQFYHHLLHHFYIF